MTFRKYPFRILCKVQGDGIVEGGIEKNAFWNCRSLKKVSLPAGISVLQKEVFRGCWSLSDVEIRNEENSILESIEEAAFSECNHISNTDFLKNVKNLKTIGDYAFRYSEITDESDNLIYASYTGEKCLLDEKDIYGGNKFSGGLQSVTLPDSVTDLGNEVFTGQPNLQIVTLGNGLTILPKNSFQNCVSLKKVILPAYLKTIEEKAFSGCIKLQDIVLPNTLETIGDEAFSDCGAVKTMDGVYYHVRYIETGKSYTSRPAGNTTAVECLVYNKDEKYNQSFGTMFLEKDAMLTEDEYKEKGSPTGYDKYIIVAEKRYAKSSEVYDNDQISKTRYTNYVLDEKTGRITESNYVYSEELGSDESINAPKEGYTGYFVRGTLYNKISVRDYYGLSSITLPNSVKSIGKKAFYNCYNLENIVLSNQITEIPESAFAVEKKENLNKYNWVATEQEPLQANYIADRVVTFPNNLETIGDNAFKNNSNLKLTNGALPANLLQIGNSAFEECHSIEKIVIPSKTKSIGDKAFYGCSEYMETDERIDAYTVIDMQKNMGLQEIDLTQASSLENIGTYAFSLTSIKQCTLPKKVTTVSQGLFATCPFLSKVICAEDTEAIKADVFSNCTELVSITVPAKATISYNAFRGYGIGSFSFSITDPEPISVSIGEEEKLPINTFINDYLRDSIQITEKNGITGFVEIANGTVEELNGWNIYKAKVKGVKEGTTKLSVVGTNNYYLYGNKVFSKAPEVTVTVNVTKKKCTDIVDTVDSAVLSIEDVQGQKYLHPQVLPEDCTEANVWLNSNESIVEVRPETHEVDGTQMTSSSALIVPKALGTSKVTLKTGSVKKDYQVNVVIPATDLILDKQEISIKENEDETIKLKPTMTYDAAKYSANDWDNYKDIISYSSADTKIATVSDDGVVKAVSAGTTQITATALGSGKTAVCEVRVLPNETMVYFTDEQGNMLDTSKPLQVQAKDVITLNIATEPVDSLSELTWEFSDLSVNEMFTHLKNGTRQVETEDKGIQDKVISMEFGADKIGTGTITVFPVSCKNKDAVSASVSVNVSADTKEAVFATVEDIEIGAEQSVFGYIVTSAGKAENIQDVKNITTDKVSFTSSNPVVASVDEVTGVVKGLSEGHVTITMKVENVADSSKSIEKVMELDVTRPAATKVDVVEKNGKQVVAVGGKLQLETILTPSNARDSIKFESLTPDIATVDRMGIITGLKAGTGRVKVTTSEKEVYTIFEFTVIQSNTPTPSPSVSVPKVTGLKVKNVKGKKMLITWKKVKNVKGYRITYALNSKFTKSRKTVNISKNSVTKTISKLKKGKTYYVKVQAYKKNGTKKVFGKVSTVKKVKIKK